eukprot:scaffold624_cov402-Prasinococcus_capsulatus_cf.AAC.72
MESDPDVVVCLTLPHAPQPGVLQKERATILCTNHALTWTAWADFGAVQSYFTEQPWIVEITGLVETPRTLYLHELLSMVSLERRLYRHRCVEAWAITVPWIGFPFSDLLDLCCPLHTGSRPPASQSRTLPQVKPLPSAKFVAYQSFYNTTIGNQGVAGVYPW